MVTVYSYLSSQSFYGGTRPAMAVREIVDKIYAIDGSWDESYSTAGSIPSMNRADSLVLKKGVVPDLRGLGLKDAMYIIESNGMQCLYSGSGHVVSQAPEAGSVLKDGATMTLLLK